MAGTERSSSFRVVLFAGLTIAATVFAAIYLNQFVSQFEKQLQEAERPEDKVMVIVASRVLYQGVTITEEDLYAVEIPPRFLTDGVFLSPEHVVGRVPRERILSNEFIRAERLSDPESGIGLNAVIPRGMRALSVPISGGAALRGFLQPGNYVDVLLTYGEQTSILMQAVFVLAVDSRMEKETALEAMSRRGRQTPNVTFLVTADQAEKVVDAQQSGSLTLALRNDLDVNYAKTAGIDVDGLLDLIRPRPTVRRVNQPKPAKKRVQVSSGEVVVEPAVVAPVPEPAPSGSILRLIRGSSWTDQRFKDN
jgi:pilus assembly protein CpaB